MPPGFHALIGAQFLSALADNALLIVAIALVQLQGQPAWWVPMLKFCFTLAYVGLAPFVGVWADARAKPRVMMAMNALKAAAVLALALGAHPLLSLALVGLGAAAYAPAKYGLVTESVPPRLLVRANGWIEVTTVCAALFGVVLGGLMVGAGVSRATLSLWPAAPPLAGAFALLLLLYASAAVLNLFIRDSGARYPRASRRPAVLVQQFRRANGVLWRDAEGGISLGITTLFWGAAATLQLAVLQWAVEALGLDLERAAYLQGAVALGVVVGAVVAGRLVALDRALRVLPLGVALGLLVPLVAAQTSVGAAVPLLVLVGALGGALVVPMNALLQHRGHVLLTAGRSIAVQNFNENFSVLLMLAVYAGLTALHLPIRTLLGGVGLMVAAITLLVLHRARLQRPPPQAQPAGSADA